MPYTRASITPTEVNAIPNFDGNTVVLPLFLEACEELILTYFDAQNLANPINSFIIKIIKGKFTGEAQNLIASRELNTWHDIKACLELNYSDQRSEDCLLTDLMQIKQEHDENPYSLGDRIRNSLNLLLTKVKLTVDQAERVMKTNMYKKTALQTYLRILMTYLNYGEYVYNKNPANLETAMAYVLERQNWLYLCKQSTQINVNNSPKFKPIPPGKNLNQSSVKDNVKVIYKPVYVPPSNFNRFPNQQNLFSNQNNNQFQRFSQNQYQPRNVFLPNMNQNRQMMVRNPNLFNQSPNVFTQRPSYSQRSFNFVKQPNTSTYKPTPMEVDPSMSQMRIAPKRPRQSLNNIEINEENIIYDENNDTYYVEINPPEEVNTEENDVLEAEIAGEVANEDFCEQASEPKN